MGFTHLVPLLLVHLFAAVPSQAEGPCAWGGLDEAADCPVAAATVASELLQREVVTEETSNKQLMIDSRVQHAVIKPPALLDSGGSLHDQVGDSGEVKVNPYKCKKSQALQSTTDDAGVTRIQKLNVKSGKYKLVFTIPTDRTDPPFRSINSCAINPKDAIIHCSMEINNKGSFLVRIDKKRVAFVAKLPGWRYGATFDKYGNYWMYGSSGLSVIKDVASKPSYSSWSYLSGGEPGVTSMKLGSDFAVIYADLDKSGSEETYLLALSGRTGRNSLYIVKVSGDSYKRWVLEETTGLPASGDTWGTAWNYENSIFFSADTGEGVFRLDDSSINITNGSASFIYMGPAQKTDWNDGLSCIGKGTPWEPDIVPQTCSGQALQATTTAVNDPDSKTYLQYLDIPTGTYQLYYEVKKSWTDPPFNCINSCAINPLNNVIYCTMEINNRGSFLVTIDKTKVGYVAKVPGWMYAGTFDMQGTFYMYGSAGLSYIENVVKMPIYESYNQLGGGQRYNGPHKLEEKLGADLVVVTANLGVQGKGQKQYLMSVRDGHLLVVLFSGDNSIAQWKLVGEGLPESEQTWGSAWNFRNKIYFAPDSGAGVYQLLTSSISLTKGTPAKFKKAGKSQTTTWNDGFSCITDISPFSYQKRNPGMVVQRESD